MAPLDDRKNRARLTAVCAQRWNTGSYLHHQPQPDGPATLRRERVDTAADCQRIADKSGPAGRDHRRHQ